MPTKIYNKEVVLFAASVAQCGYIILLHGANYYKIDVYQYAVTGAIYELITLPIIASTFLVLILYIFMILTKGKTFLTVLNTLGILINILTLLYLITSFLK